MMRSIGFFSKRPWGAAKKLPTFLLVRFQLVPVILKISCLFTYEEKMKKKFN
jgi:hypothetical protein